MVGVEKFAEHFADHSDKYVLIGGSACSILHTDVGIEFRVTTDFDVVLLVQATDPSTGFMDRFWQFLEEGGYEVRKGAEHRRLYKFEKPGKEGYPLEIELFTVAPEGILLPAGARVTPLPGDAETESLSAFLLDAYSLAFLLDGTRTVMGISVATPERLVALKAHAWANYLKDKREGMARKAKKHSDDIYRLERLIEPANRVTLPTELADHLQAWLEGQDPAQLPDRDLRIARAAARAKIRAVFDIQGTGTP